MSEDGSQRPEWLDNRGAMWGASAAVILLVLAGLVAVLVWGRGGSPAQSAPPSLPAASTAPSGANGGGSAAPGSDSDSDSDSACNLPADDQTVPKVPPPGVQWSVVDTVALPWSTTAGAVHRDGAVWTCYARTPVGALMAAAVLSVTSEGPQGVEVLEKQAVSGPNRSARIASLRQQPPEPKQPGETAVIAGYKFLDYSQSRATVQIAGAFGGQYLVVTTPLVWSDGDWKLNLDTPGGTVPGQAIPSLAGYTQWGAR